MNFNHWLIMDAERLLSAICYLRWMLLHNLRAMKKQGKNAHYAQDCKEAEVKAW